jgi:hypothetical protein
MRAKLMVVPMVVLMMVIAGLSSTAAAGGPPPASSTVTIRAQGTDLSGRVSSTAPVRCAQNRMVHVYKQIGPRGGGNDIHFASDTASLQGGQYKWSTGNTGTPGYFYAKVFPKPGCRGDTSDTIRVFPPT